MRSFTDIPYVKRAGVELCLDLNLPDALTEPVPVVIRLPGGGWRGCIKENDMLNFLAEDGIAVVSINYRISTVASAPANVYDCKAAVSWVRAQAGNYGLDPDRIGLFGSSAGGHLASLLGLTSGMSQLESETGTPLQPGTAVRAVCAFCGPSDLTRMAVPEIRSAFGLLYEVTQQYLGGPVEERLELARLVSPLTYVAKEAPPMLIVHGDADIIVPVEESIILHEALRKVGADVELRIVEGAGHAIPFDQVRDTVVAFFKRTLG